MLGTGALTKVGDVTSLEKTSVLAVICVVLLASGSVSAQSITLDGRTATAVRSGTGGRVEIDIATPDRGVSVNAFDTFNVSPGGAAFDNTSKGASAIVADVTGTGVSRMEGTLEVLGQRADVIVANPNGFELNGARFQNMRGLALIAGERQPGSLRYAVRPGDGGITVGPGGVVADVRRLDLIARSIRLDGPVGESDSAPYLRFNATAGTGMVEIDPEVAGVDDAGYLVLSGRGQQAGDAVSLTLTEGAIVSGGKLTLTADARGAGVVMAGQGLASAGEFTMSADGRITLTGARVQGLTGTRITGGAIDARQAAVSSDIGDVAMVAAGAMALDHTTISASAITLGAGERLSMQGGTVEAMADLDVTAGSLSLSSLGQDDMAILRTQQNGRLAVAGDFTNLSGLVQAYGDLSITTGGTLHNVLALDSRREPVAGFNLATLQADGALAIDAGHLHNEGGLVRGGGALTLTGGAVTNELVRLGEMETRKSCFLFLCRSHVTGAFRFSGGGLETDSLMRVDLGGDFRNLGGTVTANAGLRIDAARIDFQPLRYSAAYTLPKGPSTLFFGQRTRRFATYETGKIFAPTFGFSMIAREGLLRFFGTEVYPLALLDALDGAEIVAVPPDVTAANGQGFGLFSTVLD